MTADRRLVYRVILKVLGLLALLFLLFVFINSLFTATDKKDVIKRTSVALVALNLSGMYKGEIRKIRWEGKEIGVLLRKGNPILFATKFIPKIPHPALNGGLRSFTREYFVYFNQGDSGNCPLFYADNIFKDSCSGTRFDYAGRELGRGLQGHRLAIPPHYFNHNMLIIGQWPD